MCSCAAVDPHELNRKHAAHCLLEFVVAKRRAARHEVQQTVLAAAAAGGPAAEAKQPQQHVQELPEFALPFLVFLLAQHPDFPEEVSAARLGGEVKGRGQLGEH